MCFYIIRIEYTPHADLLTRAFSCVSSFHKSALSPVALWVPKGRHAQTGSTKSVLVPLGPNQSTHHWASQVPAGSPIGRATAGPADEVEQAVGSKRGIDSTTDESEGLRLKRQKVEAVVAMAQTPEAPLMPRQRQQRLPLHLSLLSALSALPALQLSH